MTLNFAATKPLYRYKDDYLSGKAFAEIFFLVLDPIGKGQSEPIGFLFPGTEREFSATIPNVKRTKDEPRIVVSFSGERYSVSR